MFEAHFGLRENPFSTSHDPRFVYPSPEHLEAVAHFRYGMQNGESFVLVTGEVGTGKTTAILDLVSRLPQHAQVALIQNTALSRPELIEEICRRFAVEVAPGLSKPSLLSRLEQSLRARAERGQVCLLVVDEAQNLTPEMLEEIRLLSNFQLGGGNHFLICLVGQPELEDRLAQPELRQLRQRISVKYRLQPLDGVECGRYLHHRLRVAGGDGGFLFPAETVRVVHAVTHGIPREINIVAGQAMLNAYVDGSPSVRVKHVEQVVEEFAFRSVLAEEAAEREAEASGASRAGGTAPGGAHPAAGPPRVSPRPAAESRAVPTPDWMRIASQLSAPPPIPESMVPAPTAMEPAATPPDEPRRVSAEPPQVPAEPPRVPAEPPRVPAEPPPSALPEPPAPRPTPPVAPPASPELPAAPAAEPEPSQLPVAAQEGPPLRQPFARRDPTRPSSPTSPPPFARPASPAWEYTPLFKQNPLPAAPPAASGPSLSAAGSDWAQVPEPRRQRRFPTRIVAIVVGALAVVALVWSGAAENIWSGLFPPAEDVGTAGGEAGADASVPGRPAPPSSAADLAEPPTVVPPVADTALGAAALPDTGSAEVPAEHGWTVQVASYQSMDQAQQVLTMLEVLTGVRGHIVVGTGATEGWYAVRLGDFASSQEAELNAGQWTEREWVPIDRFVVPPGQ